MKAWKSSLAVSAVAISLAGIAAAQTMPVAYQGSSTQNSQIQYFAGGFGLDEREEMKRVAGAYNLHLMFAVPTGQFVVADSVTIKKGSDYVLQVSDVGPLLYVSLPAGTYTVQASINGVVRSRTLNVGGRAPDVLMTWPASSLDVG